jgi:ribosomal protein L37AE/L43A
MPGCDESDSLDTPAGIIYGAGTTGLHVFEEVLMTQKKKYECENCGKALEVNSDSKVPDCCGKAMRSAEKMPVCEMSTTAEHSRLHGNDDACDDGRSGS